MDTIRFEWDENKNSINKRKHHLSFEEAKTVFYDVNAILFDDPDHSIYEERFLILGYTNKNKVCIVSHCLIEDGGVIRIISARPASKRERKYYEEN